MGDPGQDGGVDVVPIDSAGRIIALEGLELLTEALDVGAHEAGAAREEAPAQEGDAILEPRAGFTESPEPAARFQSPRSLAEHRRIQ